MEINAQKHIADDPSLNLIWKIPNDLIVHDNTTPVVTALQITVQHNINVMRCHQVDIPIAIQNSADITIIQSSSQIHPNDSHSKLKHVLANNFLMTPNICANYISNGGTTLCTTQFRNRYVSVITY